MSKRAYTFSEVAEKYADKKVEIFGTLYSLVWREKENTSPWFEVHSGVDYVTILWWKYSRADHVVKGFFIQTEVATAIKGLPVKYVVHDIDFSDIKIID